MTEPTPIVRKSGQTLKCPTCGKPYAFYSHYAGDQSACPTCRNHEKGDGETRGIW